MIQRYAYFLLGSFGSFCINTAGDDRRSQMTRSNATANGAKNRLVGSSVATEVTEFQCERERNSNAENESATSSKKSRKGKQFPSFKGSK